MQTSSRSIWNRARKAAAPLSAKDVAKAITIVTSEIYDEMDNLERDIRNEIPDVDGGGLLNDFEGLERRVSTLEDEFNG